MFGRWRWTWSSAVIGQRPNSHAMNFTELTSQIRRAAVSIPANIAEGYGREQTGSYIQFLRIAQGSVKELETHALIAQRLKLCGDNDVASLLELNDRVG